MNERIEELAEQAGIKIDGFGYGEGNIEKLAKLIVFECAELATKEYNSHGSIHGNDILEHFGVE
jgi:hypothetical protein